MNKITNYTYIKTKFHERFLPSPPPLKKFWVADRIWFDKYEYIAACTNYTQSIMAQSNTLTTESKILGSISNDKIIDQFALARPHIIFSRTISYLTEV